MLRPDYTFGNNNEYGFCFDDNCLVVLIDHSGGWWKTSSWLFKSALQEIDKLGGAINAFNYIKSLHDKKIGVNDGK